MGWALRNRNETEAGEHHGEEEEEGIALFETRTDQSGGWIWGAGLGMELRDADDDAYAVGNSEQSGIDSTEGPGCVVCSCAEAGEPGTLFELQEELGAEGEEEEEEEEGVSLPGTPLGRGEEACLPGTQ